MQVIDASPITGGRYSTCIRTTSPKWRAGTNYAFCEDGAGVSVSGVRKCAVGLWDALTALDAFDRVVGGEGVWRWARSSRRIDNTLLKPGTLVS